MKHHPDLSDPDDLPPKLLLPPTEVIYANAMAHSAAIKREVAYRRIADALDLAVLKPTATEPDVQRACLLVQQHEIKSICVATTFVSFAMCWVDRVCAVVGFPHGNTTATVKYVEAVEAMDRGAREIDVVLNYGRFLAGNRERVKAELAAIVTAARPRRVLVKAILETCCYTTEQIADACRLCVEAGVDYVKTSTGFASGGATPEAVKTMLDAVGGQCRVKASGGINTYADAMLYLNMGCDRIGSSKFLELLP